MTDLTTAEVLGQFRRELEDAGIDPATTASLITFAGRSLIDNEGVGVHPVRTSEHCCICAVNMKAAGR